MIPILAFGHTGHQSTRTLFGGAALGEVTQEQADHTLDVLLRYEVNHIDVAASYGEAELRVAPWLKRHPDRFFLATKTGERTYQGAKEEFHRSLERLGVAQVDLIQLHNLVHPDEWDVAMGPGGALEALVEAREQGLVRFIGVTGHGSTVAAMHQRSLARFDFDSVLLPYNYPMMQDPRYAQDFEALARLCCERNVAMQTIKSITRGPWGTTKQTRACWYEPLEDQADIDRAVHWVLGRPDVFLNTVGDVDLLPRVLDAAGRFEAGTGDEEMGRVAEQRQMTALFAG